MKKISLISCCFVVLMIFSVNASNVIIAGQNQGQVSNVMTETVETPIIDNSIMPVASNVFEEIGGVREDGFVYGLKRLESIMTKKGQKAEITYNEKISDTMYKVVVKSENAYRNGTWLVEIYPSSKENEKVLDGYQYWFGWYNVYGIRKGTAQVKKVK